MLTKTGIVLGCYLSTLAWGWLLRGLNLRHLRRHGDEVPPCFVGTIDRERLQRSSGYTVAQSRLGLFRSILEAILLVLFLFGGLLGWYDRWVGGLGLSFITSGLVFFILLSLAEGGADLPFNLYHTFVLEQRYGFNRTTLSLWLGDLLKSALITLLLLGGMLAGFLALVLWSPQRWWLWAWVMLAVVSLFLMYLSPYLIEPLFNKYEPLKDPELEAALRAMLERAGLRVSTVQQVDASRRSGHSNAYFTGIGRVKRIVLYDTLLDQMSRDEILAIFAHEVGHWQKGHIWKRLVVMEAGMLAVCYGAYCLVGWQGLPELLGYDTLSFNARLLMAGFLGSLAAFPLTPVGNWFSRQHERQADAYAVSLCGSGAALASGLVKLSRENLANLHPHPLYAAWHFSHPPVVERVERLLSAGRDETATG